MEVDGCVFCGRSLESADCVTVTAKGVDGIEKARKERRISELNVCAGQKVHRECRAKFINPKYMSLDRSKDQATVVTRELRSGMEHFNFATKCIFCAEDVKPWQLEKNEAFTVRTMDFDRTILVHCNSRKDEWATNVHGRIQSAIDLHAVDALYHQMCNVNFRTGKAIPLKYRQDQILGMGLSSTGSTAGRPVHDVRFQAFLKVVEFLRNNDDEQTTLAHLQDKMKEYLVGTDQQPYSSKYLRQSLLKHFQDEIVINSVNTVSNVVTFRKTCDRILNDFYKSTRLDTEAEKLKLISAAAEILRADIKARKTNTNVYASTEDISDIGANVAYLPSTLNHFLRSMITGKNKDLKTASIGQAIMQAVRPRVLITPLQLGLAVQVHHTFNSKMLVNTLHNLGFSSSYTEVQHFEKSAAAYSGTDIFGITEQTQVQYVADNIDHNTVTLDGHGTFHGMGIIAAVTPYEKGHFSVVRRRDVTLDELRERAAINIRHYKAQETGMRNVKFESLVPFTTSCDSSRNVDMLWNMASLLIQTPAWNGYMQMIHRGSHPGKSEVVFLPMLAMDPTDETCIYSTLLFIANHAERHNVTPVLTFDQPLWWKAFGIVLNEPPESPLHKMVLRLGGLHVEMSFLGAIGNLMAGSGLSTLLSQIYAENTVKHMLSGHAITRAIRGHLIVYAALYSIIAVLALGDQNNQDTRRDLAESATLLQQLLCGDVNISEVQSSKAIPRLERAVDKYIETLKDNRTALLWIQYMRMVDILRSFIKADRTGDWNLHLEATSSMLPYFAASGHNFYAKSAYLYLQNMHTLQNTNPEVYEKFLKGFHVVRRSDRQWAGLPTDLVIEQMLMRSVKSTGGLTRGRPLTEMQRLVWLLSRPICSQVNASIQNCVDVAYVTSDQHVDSSTARRKRDDADLDKVKQFFVEYPPFTDDQTLRSITTGAVAGSACNVDSAKDIGDKILQKMKGLSAAEVSFKRIDQATTMERKVRVKVQGEEIVCTNELLFQRLTLLAQRNTNMDISEAFTYELSVQPDSLFTEDGYMRESTKHILATKLRCSGNSENRTLRENVDYRYVLDGGSLLYRIPWPPKATYKEVYTAYETYVKSKYGNAVIVFDGYDGGASTKDEVHKRRSSYSSVRSAFEPHMKITLKKDVLLSNFSNRQRFVDQLCEHFANSRVEAIKAAGDADKLIVSSALDIARAEPTVLVGDDTDLLVLLLHYYNSEIHREVFLRPEPKKNAKHEQVFDIQVMQQSLGQKITKHILFLHAVLGCDTVSKPHGIGKGYSLDLMQKNSLFEEAAEVFGTPNRDKEEIAAAGEKVIAIMYKADPTICLNTTRLQMFMEKVTKSVVAVTPEKLPPTSAAAKFHSYRIYHQVQEWKGVALNPLEWGWREQNDVLLPIKTDLPPAPDYLLKIISCKCKSDCGRRNCSCRKHGVVCTTACSNCRGVSCTNIEAFTSDDKDNSDDEI